MKKLILCLMMSGCLLDVSAQYNAVVLDNTNDIVLVRCIGYGRTTKKAAKDAELTAIKTVLFSKSSPNKYSLPLIQDSQPATEKELRKFLKKYFKGEYMDFIAATDVVTPFGKNALRQKCITLDVYIRVPQQRAYLENNGINQKFGL